MKIVSKNKNNVKPTKKKKVVNHLKEKRKHPQYGTSKLEERFASEFLDRLGVKYEYQFEAKDIGRFYDFYLPEHRLLIELDGDYDLEIISKKSDFQILTDDEKTRNILRHLLSMKKRPKMFMNEPSYDKLSLFLYGYAWGIHENKETDGYDVICWSEIEQYVNDLILPEVDSKRHTDEELFFIFFDVLERTIIERFPQYKDLL